MVGKRLRVAAVLLAGALAACGSGVPAQNREGGQPIRPVTLTMANVNGVSPDLEAFTDAVKTASAGAVEITVTNDWRRGEANNEVDLVKDIAAGKADLGVAAARAFDKVGVNAFQALSAPFLIDSYDLQRRVLESATAASMLPGLRSAGLAGIGYLVGPLRRPIGFTTSLDSLAAFKDARIGIRPSRVAEMTFDALGATAVVNPPGDITGFTGMEGSFSTVRDYFDRGVDSFVGNVIFWPRMDVLFANAASFDRLSAEQRAILTGAAKTALAHSDESVRATGDEVQGILCALGLTIKTASDADLAKLVKAVEPVYAEIEKDPQTKAAIVAIRDLRGPAAKPEAPPPCPAPAASPAPVGPSPIDGIWTTTFTREELANSPQLLDRGEINDGNWGDLQLELENGRVTFSQHNDLDRYTTSGHFTVDGSDVTFRFLTGGNAGETFLFRWSIYQGTLRFERHPTMPISPTPYVLEPWTKGG